jgi:hypothetical protein
MNVAMKVADTIISTDRCGPRLCRYDLTESHVLILLTLFKRKCGIPDFPAFRNEVILENNFANRNRCLYVFSATARRKNANKARNNLSKIEIKIIARILILSP